MRKIIPICLDGQEYAAYVTQADQKGLKLLVTVTIGEEEFRFAGKPPFYNYIDEEFTLQGETMRFVLHMGDCDLVRDGKFLTSGKLYAPASAFSPLFLIPMLLNLLVPVMTLGGAFPIMATIVGLLLTWGMAGSPFDSFVKRFLLALAFPLFMVACFSSMYGGLALLKLL